ncbi:O-methyltransferase ZRP4 [Dichanthelium oligosanthes]|uniref:O-methyltransferase ZRP4 n=1 Tax=Dichanthelium oligosanthes TaxID=888268 RepID=A0A1E5VL78_9POAL|nr:O-methyltransferase ZRP4 [Dichanthelium oligosanthes]
MDSIQEQHDTDQQALLDAQLELWHSAFAFIKSMALKSAMQLRIADAIHHHGGTATITQIASKVTLHPSKIPCMRRLMRVLTVTGIFSIAKHSADDDGDCVYGLTPASRLLVGSLSLSPTLSLFVNNVFVSPFLDLATWFEHELPDLTLFEMSHGKVVWDVIGHDETMSPLFNAGMVADSHFLMDIAIKECGDIFQGISSLIDVAGGHGAAAQAISKAFPHIECSVLDLAHVVASAPACTGINFIAGDMFESIPSANAVFLKWVMHDWLDSECVAILKNCKKAIPLRDAGGKVIIVDTVVGAGPSNLKHRETQVLYDLFFMIVNGIERDEQEWRKIIFEAGFTDYKIIPVLGVRSIIELYP